MRRSAAANERRPRIPYVYVDHLTVCPAPEVQAAPNKPAAVVDIRNSSM